MLSKEETIQKIEKTKSWAMDKFGDAEELEDRRKMMEEKTNELEKKLSNLE